MFMWGPMYSQFEICVIIIYGKRIYCGSESCERNHVDNTVDNSENRKQKVKNDYFSISISNN